jgi:hypothetical protein
MTQKPSQADQRRTATDKRQPVGTSVAPRDTKATLRAMPRLSTINRCTRWSTLVALVLATLVPSLAHALRHARGEALPFGEICTSTGTMRVIALNSNDSDGAPASSQAHAFEQCLTCALHHGASAPPPALPSVASVQTAAPALPALFLHAPRPLFVWSAAQPRAPPSVS